jgi:hypothetical protein
MTHPRSYTCRSANVALGSRSFIGGLSRRQTPFASPSRNCPQAMPSDPGCRWETSVLAPMKFNTCTTAAAIRGAAVSPQIEARSAYVGRAGLTIGEWLGPIRKADDHRSTLRTRLYTTVKGRGRSGLGFTGRIAIRSFQSSLQLVKVWPRTVLHSDAIGRIVRTMSVHFHQTDFSVVIKNRALPPKPWRWEIYRAGRNNPIARSSVLYETVAAANRAGKAALKEFLTEFPS